MKPDTVRVDRTSAKRLASSLDTLEKMFRGLTRTQETILQTVMDHPGLKINDIADALYGHREDGGPDFPANVIYMGAHRIRRKIMPHGYVLLSRGSRWYVEKIPHGYTMRSKGRRWELVKVPTE